MEGILFGMFLGTLMGGAAVVVILLIIRERRIAKFNKLVAELQDALPELKGALPNSIPVDILQHNLMRKGTKGGNHNG